MLASGTPFVLFDVGVQPLVEAALPHNARTNSGEIARAPACAQEQNQKVSPGPFPA